MAGAEQPDAMTGTLSTASKRKEVMAGVSLDLAVAW